MAPYVLFILCNLMFTPYTKGQYSLTVSPNPAVTGATVTFTCTTSPVQTAVLWTETTSGVAKPNTYSYYLNNGQCERSNGNPPADYTFTCNTAGVFTVRFPANYNRHSGSMWKCGNAFGNFEESSSITLSVHVPLTSVTLLNSSALTVDQDTSVTLVCETNPTNPVSTITWRRGTQTISQGVTSSTRSTTQGTVRVSSWSKSVQWGDHGEYSCLASWSSPAVTKTSQSLSLVVQVPVSAVTLTNITSPNQEIRITEDSTLVLSCQTSPAYPAPTVRWYITGIQTSSGVVNRTYTQTNGQYITVSTITKTVTKDNDRDTYYCRAGGQQSLTASVNVYYGPDVGQLKLTKPSVVAEGVQVTLNCSTLTSVNPDVNFSWSYEDNIPITSGIGSKQGSARDTWSQTLTVTPVRDSNRQVVRCRISNTEANVGDNVLASTDLDVNYGPDSGEVWLTKTSIAIEHEPVTLTCRTTNNVKPDVTFTWRIDGSEVTSGTGVKQGSSGSMWSQTLTLTPNRDQRSVGCTVSNSQISRQSSASVDVDVNYPPDISMSPVEGTENTNLTLRCTASGNPSIYHFKDFTQYWGGQLIQRRPGSPTGNRYEVTIPRVTYQDSGVYVCTAGNNVKQPSHQNASITVKSSPIFSKDSIDRQTVGAEVNENVTLSQYIYCSPNCTSISWNVTTRNTSAGPLQQTSISPSRVHLDVYGVEVEEEGYILSYNVSNFQQQDVGLYTATACNSVGCSTSSVSLSGSGPPVTPRSFTAVNVSTNTVTLSWSPQYAGGSFNQEFHIEYRKYNGTDNWMVKIFPDIKESIMSGTVDGLTPDTAYVFRIRSVSDRKNGNNQSPYSDTTVIQTEKAKYIVTISPNSSPLGVGAGIGIGIGISVIVVAVAVLTFIFWKRNQDGHSRERSRQEDNQNIETRGIQQSEYAKFQHNVNQNTYEKISSHYQNTGFQMTPVDHHDKSGMLSAAPVNHTYMNTPLPYQGPAYENTAFTDK